MLRFGLVVTATAVALGLAPVAIAFDDEEPNGVSLHGFDTSVLSRTDREPGEQVRGEELAARKLQGGGPVDGGIKAYDPAQTLITILKKSAMKKLGGRLSNVDDGIHRRALRLDCHAAILIEIANA